ncbi:hypothetical protein GGD56_000500 [Rhizobium mongolense]|uniref:Uncharacterized protein n=1 Tax=Rhizobium mongolense TaxID=57676 RepID=A0ABR6IFP0_9HYPH|nr:hypothetical protein [Rhizobium mongolense]
MLLHTAVNNKLDTVFLELLELPIVATGFEFSRIM